jgi:nucleotide-binding universal stress UspA family protein
MREISEETMMKLLVPVDGSPASLRAAKLAVEIAAGRDQTTIILLNVQNIRMVALTEGAEGVMAIWIEEEEERVSREALREAIAACEAAGILFSVRIERGKPAAMIHRGGAPDFVEVGEAGIAVDDVMRRQRRVQLVG